jgi:hypothetical protein
VTGVTGKEKIGNRLDGEGDSKQKRVAGLGLRLQGPEGDPNRRPTSSSWSPVKVTAVAELRRASELCQSVGGRRGG